MIKLYHVQSGAPVGEISEEQFHFIRTQLEEEATTDQDYYINQATVDLFEVRGADPTLVALLRAALGDDEEMDIRWEAA